MFVNRYIFLLLIISFFFLVADNKDESLDIAIAFQQQDENDILQQLRKEKYEVSSQIKQASVKLKRCRSYLNRLQINSAQDEESRDLSGEMVFVNQLLEQTSQTLVYLELLKDSFQYKMEESRDSLDLEQMNRWRKKNDFVSELKQKKYSEITLLQSRVRELKYEELLYTDDLEAKSTAHVQQTDSISSLISEQRLLHRRLFEVNTQINNELIKNNCGWIGTSRYQKGEQDELPFKLQHPVKNGIVVSGFGVQQHPLEGKILIKNLGLDIQVSKNARIVAVADGEVSTIFESRTMGQVAILKYNEYQFVYAGFDRVDVKEGEWVPAGSILGFSPQEDFSKVDFELWNGKKALNPELYFP